MRVCTVRWLYLFWLVVCRVHVAVLPSLHLFTVGLGKHFV